MLGGADPISRIIRRLSFLSPMPPLSSATDDGEGAADDGAGAGGGQGVRRTATAPAVATHARHIGVRCRAAAVGSGGAAAAAAAVWDAPPVRVRVPPVASGGGADGADGAWADLLRGAEDRLQAAGSLPEGHAVVGLKSADGLRVLRFDDLQEGEVLEAMTEVAPPSDNPFAPFSPPPACGGAVVRGARVRGMVDLAAKEQMRSRRRSPGLGEGPSSTGGAR